MISVMVVDDEPTTRRVVRLALENAGYEVATAGDGAEALKILRDRRFDVLVTDLNMPRMDGRELCEAIAAECAGHEPLIFVLTARPGEGHRTWATRHRERRVPREAREPAPPRRADRGRGWRTRTQRIRSRHERSRG